MAALRVTQESPNQLVLGVPLAQRLPNLLSIGFLVLVGISILSQFGDGALGQDPASILVILFLAFFALRSISAAFATTIIKLDGTARLATRSNTLLGLRLSQTSMAFDRIQQVVIGSSAPVSFGNPRLRGGWLVRLASPDGPGFLVNWNGTHDEMLPIGSKVANLVNKPLLDEFEQARTDAQSAPELQPIKDFGGGGGSSYAPPVALPSPLGGQTLASQLPDKTPPPNTLSLDSASPDHARFEQEATQPVSAPSLPDMATMGTGASPQTYSAPPALELPDQAPLDSVPPVQTSIPDVPSAVGPAPASAASMPRTLQELQKAIADDPTDSVAYFQLGWMLQQRGSVDQALDMYQNAAHLDPMNGSVQNNLGALYLQRGKMKEAELAFRRAVGLDPFSVAAHYNLGLLLARMGRRQDAQQEFSRAQQNANTSMERQLADNAVNGRLGGPIISGGN